ncbi:hypothetical protein [Acetobacter conturbans]|uniref:Methyltransferase n=1 Tax=Acetobacter conturbans TaxID=1737472 RepID=A0ABX0K0X3_9PROT|nr:hypothetical protein [Acetobacter conturbans]NHN87920.1 hypothetical protein [Acetobacter conturbans]
MMNEVFLKAIDAMLQLSMATQQACETSQKEIGYLVADEAAKKRAQKRLHGHYSQVYSQHFEDGYLAEIFSRIGTRTRNFLEIGVEAGLQNTTRLLLEQGWSGVWVEGSPADADKARASFSHYIESGKLKIISGFVTCENIDQLLDEAGVEQEFDLITVDVDYNTSHIWRAMNRTARVYCIEYNASIPPSVAIEVPYDPSGMWDGTNFFGAGLNMMERIGREKGVALIGCDIQGVNAFFVSENECEDRFCAPYTAENHHESARYSLLTHLGHAPSPVARVWSCASAS